MADYTTADLAKAAYRAGFRGTDLLIAVAVSLAENSGRQLHAVNHNTNGTVDRGPWQINSAHNFSGNPYDLQTNANQAFSVWHSQGWAAWRTYSNGTYKLHGKQANQGVTRAHLMQQTVNDIANGVLPHNAGDALIVGGGKVKDAAGSIGSAASAVPTLIGHVLSPEFWKMVGLGALALVLIGIGVVVMSESNDTVRRATEAAAVAA